MKHELLSSHSANGPWDKSLNFIFPTKHVITESLKFSHWLSESWLQNVRTSQIQENYSPQNTPRAIPIANYERNP